MKQEPDTVLNQYKEEVGTLGAETGGYETEIRYYKALGETSEVSSKMAEEAYSGQFKYSKSLQKTLSILQDKTAKLHDHQEVAELKEAIKALHEARDREGYLIEKLTWYQDKVQQCTKPKIETDVENDAENTNLPSDEDAKLKALAKGDFTGNNLGILPSIKETNGISTESSEKIKQRPLPPTAVKYDEKYPRTKTARGRLPPINTPGSANEGIPVHPPVSRIDSLLKSQKKSEEKSTIPYDDDITSLLKSRKVPKEKAAREKVKVPRLDLSLLRRGNEQKDEARKTTKLPSININQKVTELKHVPKPPKGSPKTPTLVRKIRSFLGWK